MFSEVGDSLSFLGPESVWGRRDQLEGQRSDMNPLTPQPKERAVYADHLLVSSSAQVIAVDCDDRSYSYYVAGFHQPAAVDHGGRQNQSLQVPVFQEYMLLKRQSFH